MGKWLIKTDCSFRELFNSPTKVDRSAKQPRKFYDIQKQSAFSKETVRILMVSQWFDPEPAFKGLAFARELVASGHQV